MNTRFAKGWKAPVIEFLPGSKKAVKFGIHGAIGGAIGSLIGEVIPGGSSFLGSVIWISLWFGIIGACVAVALLIGSSHYLRREFQFANSARAGALVGFLAGSIAGGLAQFAYAAIGPTEFLRVLCWGAAGGLLGYGLSFRIPNLKYHHGLWGGMSGGLIGGCLFILLSFLLGGTIGRFFGVASIGLCIGSMIILIEDFAMLDWKSLMNFAKAGPSASN